MSSIQYIGESLILDWVSHDTEKKKLNIVDVGCGNGDEVFHFIQKGYNAFGCDFRFKSGSHVESLQASKRLKVIDSDYRLPFPDHFADIVYSNQVVEHVKDIEGFFSEIKRISKSDGIGVHCYPSINRIIEPHIKVPLATRFRSNKWIHIWQKQKLFNIPEKSWANKGTEQMAAYLQNKTSYRSNKQIKNIASQFFGSVWFDGDLLLKSISHKKKGRVFALLPVGGWLFNSLWTSLLITRK